MLYTRLWLFCLVFHLTRAGVEDCQENPLLEDTIISHDAARAIASRQRISSAQRRAFAQLFSKIGPGFSREAKNITIVALGGSMMAGRGTCGVHCSYSASFACWLQDAFTVKVRYHNRAQGGTTTAGSLPVLAQLSSLVSSSSGQHGDSIKSIDIFLIDFSINDLYEEQDWDEGGQTADQPHRGFSRVDKVFAATESFLRYLLRFRPTSAVILVESPLCSRLRGISSVSASPRDMDTARAHKKAGLIYGVPFISYERMLGEGACQLVDVKDRRSGLRVERNGAWGDLSLDALHPPSEAHDHIASALSSWFMAFRDRASRESWGENASRDEGAHYPTVASTTTKPFMLGEAAIAPIALEEKYRVCDQPRSIFDAQDTFRSLTQKRSHISNWSLPRVVDGNWSLSEDVSGKAGWIGSVMTSRSKSVISFPLSFGYSPRMVVVYTKGYDHFGDATFTLIPGAGGWVRNFTITGCCNSHHVTQSELLTANVKQAVLIKGSNGWSNGVLGFNVKPYSKHELHVAVVPAKGSDGRARKSFKINSVSSC